MCVQFSQVSFCGSNPRILITGATGYIGNHLSSKLAKEGYDLTVCGRDRKKLDFLKGILAKINRENNYKSRLEFVNLDLTDPIKTDKFFGENRGADAVVHLAGLNSNARSITNPNETYKTNLFGSFNVIDSMSDKGMNKILFVSTGNVYGQVKNTAKINERYALNPETPYAKSKVMAEELVRDYKAIGLQSIILRLFNVAGAGSKDDLTIGANVIAILMNRLKNGTEFVLNGNKHGTFDGTTIRDFLHVDDACEAMKFSLKKLLNGKESGLYNVGSGKGTSLGEIIKLSEKTSGKTLNLKINQNQQYEPPVLIVDNSEIKKETGWKPLLGIKEIITDAWEWSKNH